MGLQDILDISVLCGIGALSANWAVLLCLAAAAAHGSDSKISTHRRHGLDNDCLLLVAMATIGLIVAVAAHFLLGRIGAAAGATRMVTVLVSGALGLLVPTLHARRLNRIYLRRAQQNLEIVSVDTERNLLLVKGAVPGASGGDRPTHGVAIGRSSSSRAGQCGAGHPTRPA